EHVQDRRVELRVCAADEGHVVGALHGVAHGLPHASGRTGHGDVDHAATSAGVTASTAPLNASSSPPTPPAESRSGSNSSCASVVTSSTVTASMAATSSASDSGGKSISSGLPFCFSLL